MATRDIVSVGSNWDRRHEVRSPPPLRREPDRAKEWLLTRSHPPVVGLAVAVAGLIIAWAGVALMFKPAQFHVIAPRAEIGAEAAVAAIRIFCAVVLVLFVAEGVGQRRLRWVAGGFVILGLGSAIFGYLVPLVGGMKDLNTSLYTNLLVLAIADVLFAIGLLPAFPPRFTLRLFFVSVFAFIILGGAVVGGSDLLPPLVRSGSQATIRANELSWSTLTAWHWILLAVPLALAVAAAVGAVACHRRSEGMGTWLVLAMIVFAGAHLHNVFWPATFQSVVTSTNLLRLASAAILAVGGVFELRRAAAERADLLVAEQKYSASLSELAILKADFTAMVAHELGSPIAAIRAWADVLGTELLQSEEKLHALETIRAETVRLHGLVADVQSIATVERDDFTVLPREMPVADLLAAAGDLNRTLPGHHPLLTSIIAENDARADPERIGQVLRNLLGNAAKYAPPGSTIELHATRNGARVRIEVVDHGPGIAQHDHDLVFQKYGRGRNQVVQRVAGIGLGLYLSRRIVEAHGSELTLMETPGGGATFGFELEVAE